MESNLGPKRGLAPRLLLIGFELTIAVAIVTNFMAALLWPLIHIMLGAYGLSWSYWQSMSLAGALICFAVLNGVIITSMKEARHGHRRLSD
jgi:hypothetical protein